MKGGGGGGGDPAIQEAVTEPSQFVLPASVQVGIRSSDNMQQDCDSTFRNRKTAASEARRESALRRGESKPNWSQDPSTSVGGDPGARAATSMRLAAVGATAFSDAGRRGRVGC